MKKFMAVVLLGLLVGLSAAAVGCGSSSSTQTPGTVTQPNMVNIENLSFVPDAMTVNVGDTVTWVNNDSVDHTVTGDKNGTDDAFDSGTMKPGDHYAFTFTQAGEQPYHCNIHSFMHGTITIQSPGS